jgi:hypothetical protein
MKEVKITEEELKSISSVKLEDFSLFEEKMTKIKYLKALKQNLDKSLLLSAIDELELKGKKISANKVKKICKKVLINMIEEVGNETR